MHAAKPIVEGPAREHADVTVDVLVDAWLRTKAHLSVKELEAVRLATSAVRARWGGELASSVTRSDAQEWVRCGSGLSGR